jgi:hypothetical protein
MAVQRYPTGWAESGLQHQPDEVKRLIGNGIRESEKV